MGTDRYVQLEYEDGNYNAQEINNKWIVPYNKYLLRSMNCHGNVELCMSIRSIKYVNKGCDQAIYQLQTNQQGEVDEILVLDTLIVMKLHKE